MSETENKTDSLSRLGVCEVCAKNAAIYACPKCEVKTCSLSCVQIHKRELNCDGIRDRTKFLPLSEMTEREFMSDYCFLEECTRYAQNRKEERSKHCTHQQRQLPVPLYRMRQEATKRDIRLQFLLPNFSRHKQNTTYLNWKLHRFFWHIEWFFTHADSETPTRFVDSRCDENQTLVDLLHKYLDLREETALQQRKLLQHHQSAGIGQLTLWLRAEGVRRSGQRCYALAAHKSLRDNLAGKTIIEFPTIYVSYEQRPPIGYDIIDSDEEGTETIANVAVSSPADLGQKRPSKSEKKQQPAAKKSKSTAAAKELPELHNLYDLAASLAAEEDEEDEDDDNNDDDNDGDNDDDNEYEANSDNELPSENEEPLTTCTY